MKTWRLDYSTKTGSAEAEDYLYVQAISIVEAVRLGISTIQRTLPPNARFMVWDCGLMEDEVF